MWIFGWARSDGLGFYTIIQMRSNNLILIIISFPVAACVNIALEMVSVNSKS